jgi:hypothetical protein
VAGEPKAEGFEALFRYILVSSAFVEDAKEFDALVMPSGHGEHAPSETRDERMPPEVS